jgi:hypothetical protein
VAGLRWDNEVAGEEARRQTRQVLEDEQETKEAAAERVGTESIHV